MRVSSAWGSLIACLIRFGLSEHTRLLDATIIGTIFVGAAVRYHVHLGHVDGAAALVWEDSPHAWRLSLATALGLCLAAYHGGLLVLRSVPRWMVHLTLAYTGRHLIKELPAEYGPRWWTIKLLLCPSLMIHLDLFGLAADGSRAAMAYAAHALPWASLRALTTAARCVVERHVERQPASLYGRTLDEPAADSLRPLGLIARGLSPLVSWMALMMRWQGGALDNPLGGAHGGARASHEVSFVCSYWLNMTQGY